MPIATPLKAELTARYGRPSYYMEFQRWKLTPTASIHVHPGHDACHLYVSDHRSTMPRLLTTVNSPDGVGAAIVKVEEFVRDQQRRG
jgi:hypothetical protein